MYKFEMNQVLDEKFLTRLVEKFRVRENQYYDKLDRYYHVKNDGIRYRSMKFGKPNNKLYHGFARYITNMVTSYFAGKPIEYIIDDPEYRECMQDYLNDQYNYDYEISKAASKKGIAFELLYINEKVELKTKKYEAQDIIPIYSSRPDEFLNGFVKLRETRDLDGQIIRDYADVYDKTDIYHFSRPTKAGQFELDHIEPHYLSDVPLVVYWNSEEITGDYECILSQIDAYDRAQSNTANDMDYFTDAYLVVVGAAGGFVDENGDDIKPEEAERNLRDNRIMYLDEKGDAKFLIKQSDDSSQENYKDRLFRDIFFTSQVPPMTDESFAGDLSGIALRYKLIGLEQLAIMKENKMRLAKQKKIKMITEWINFKKSKHFDASSVKQKYTRNFVENVSEIVENVGKLEGIVSKETQLTILPADIVSDAHEELEKIRLERDKEEDMYSEPIGVEEVDGSEGGLLEEAESGGQKAKRKPD